MSTHLTQTNVEPTEATVKNLKCMWVCVSSRVIDLLVCLLIFHDTLLHQRLSPSWLQAQVPPTLYIISTCVNGLTPAVEMKNVAVYTMQLPEQ